MITYILITAIVILSAFCVLNFVQYKHEADVELFQRVHIIYLLESICEAQGIEVDKVVRKDD